MAATVEAAMGAEATAAGERAGAAMRVEGWGAAGWRGWRW